MPRCPSPPPGASAIGAPATATSSGSRARQGAARRLGQAVLGERLLEAGEHHGDAAPPVLELTSPRIASSSCTATPRQPVSTRAAGLGANATAFAGVIGSSQTGSPSGERPAHTQTV